MTDMTEAEINDAKALLRSLANPVQKTLKRLYSEPVIQPVSPRLDVQGAKAVLESLNILGNLDFRQLDNDPEYRGKVLAALALVDPNSPYSFKQLSSIRKQDVGINYRNIAGIDARVINYYALVTDRIRQREGGFDDNEHLLERVKANALCLGHARTGAIR